MKQTNCCENCIGNYLDDSEEQGCQQVSCPCHQDKQDTKECVNGHKMTGIGFDDCCPECEGRWKQQPTDWEKEFDEMDFSEWKYEKDMVKYIMMCREKIKSFIHSLLARQKEELVEKIENKRDYCVENNAQCNTYNQALGEIIELIKNK
jgi:hypothetical protein